MTSQPALLLVGHGIEDELGVEALRSLVALLSERNPSLLVAGGSGRQSPPPLSGVVGELAGAGAAGVVALPLGPGGSEDVARGLETALAHEAGQRDGMAYACAAPLRTHDFLPLLERRLEEALGRVGRAPDDRTGTTVLLVGPGTTGTADNAEVHRAARLLWEGSGYGGVECAFVSQAAPDVASGLDRCHALGARKVVVLPCFLLPGAYLERISRQVAGWSGVHPESEVTVADVPAADPSLAALVEARYHEAAKRGAPSGEERGSLGAGGR